MSKFKLVAIEEMSSTHEVDANSYHEAIEKLEKQIDSGELPLEDLSSNYIRTWSNKYSKLLDEKINMLIYYNPKMNQVTISHNNNNAEYTCVDVNDLINGISTYCKSFIEDNEITVDMIENSKIALRNNFSFFPVSIDKIDFFDKLTKTGDKVKVDEYIYDVYCASDFETVLLVDDFFGNNIGYSMEEFLLSNDLENGVDYE